MALSMTMLILIGVGVCALALLVVGAVAGYLYVSRQNKPPSDS